MNVSLRPPSLAAPQRREVCLLAGVLTLTLLAWLAPAVPADAFDVGIFSDSRTWHGLPNAVDVLSNLPFLAMGLWGFHTLRGVRKAPPGAWLFFMGLVLTAAGSAFYHLQPDTGRLIADRAGMAVAFAGLIGMAVSERVSRRAGEPMAMYLLAMGLLAAWVARDNLLPWALVQFGGMALVVVLALMRPVAGAWGIGLGAVISFYALAKAFEMGDALLFETTHSLIAGHTVKHLLAACAAWPVIRALRHNRILA